MSDRKIQLLRSRKMHFILIFSFVLIGAGFIILSQAAVNTTSIEAEVASPLPPARLVQDSSASKGNALRFGVATPSGTGMSVVGNAFKKDGVAFYPKGFNSIGILQPDNCPRKKGDPTTAAANFNQNMFTALKNTWKGNIIRLQVSQKGSDPQDSELKSGHAAYNSPATRQTNPRISCCVLVNDQGFMRIYIPAATETTAAIPVTTKIDLDWFFIT